MKTGRWPCAMCGKGVGANSIQCTAYCGWVHKRYSGARCPLVTTIQSFRYLLIRFDPEVQSYQFVEKYSWIKSIGFDFHVGVDGFSVYFIVLTALLTLICIVASLFTAEYA